MLTLGVNDHLVFNNGGIEQHCSADDEKVDVNKFSCIILNINLYMLI